MGNYAYSIPHSAASCSNRPNPLYFKIFVAALLDYGASRKKTKNVANQPAGHPLNFQENVKEGSLDQKSGTDSTVSINVWLERIVENSCIKMMLASHPSNFERNEKEGSSAIYNQGQLLPLPMSDH